jgi:HK97 gp10 family phage protein
VAEYRDNPAGLAAIQYASARYARRVADEVRDDMERLVPVDTGLLKASINVEAVGDTTYITVGDNGAFYWAFQEFGTSKMAARPFIRPALDRRRGVVGLGGGL